MLSSDLVAVLKSDRSLPEGHSGTSIPAADPSRAIETFNQLMIETSHDFICILDAEGCIRYVNDQGARLLEEENPTAILGRTWLLLFSGPDQLAAKAALSGALEGIRTDFNAFSPTAKGNPKWWSIALRRIPPAGSSRDQVLIVSRDMTEHLQVEKALRESEEAFRKIFEEGPIGMILGDTNFYITKVNNAFCSMLGYTETELRGAQLRDIAHPEDAELDQEQIQRMLTGEIQSFQSEKRYLTCRKRVVWGLLTVSLVRDAEGQPMHTVAMIENIDERKKAEQKFLAYQDQLQSLASELSLSEERERRRIAAGLHDRIGQTLAFAKLKLGALSQHSELNGSSELITEIRNLIEQSLMDTRSLTFELSPPVLYELGLVPALEWLARRIQHDHGITTRFHDDGQPKLLEDDLRIVLFQAVRELLVNVVKHARAKHAQVFLRRDGDAIRIIIEDDGIGFDPNQAQNSRETSGFGLFSIRERLHYLGGQVKIRSELGSGARITLIAPLRFDERHSKTL